MNNEHEIKELVKQKYSAIADQSKQQNQASCCGAACCGTEDHNTMAEDYATIGGYNPDADLGLGCGIPTQYAKINEGDTVIDLGSGTESNCCEPGSGCC